VSYLIIRNCKILFQLSVIKTAQQIIDQLMIEADAWLSGNHNPDDITLVVIKHA